MSMVFMLIIAPFAFLIVHFTTKLLFDNKEAIIMIQDKIMERKREPVVDDIVDEALKYDVVVKPINEAPKVKRETKSIIHKLTGGEIELRNDLLKCLAVIGLAGLSAWWKLASPILYVPSVILPLLRMSYKVGEWKGQTK
jgi:hypothetical protein